jgi:hypothetical protein
VVGLSAKFCMLINEIIPATKKMFTDLSTEKQRQKRGGKGRRER